MRRELRNELEMSYSRRPIVRGKQTIRDALAVYSTLFVHARYAFESGSNITGGSIDELVALLGFFGDHIATLPRREFPASDPGPPS